MVIFPAIDIKDGACVRLYKGEMSSAEKVADSHVETAKAFKAAGAEWIHMVDLNGAVDGKRINTHIFTEVADTSGLNVEVGGGIRTLDDIEFYLSRGIKRVIIGSAAVKNPQLVKEACEKYGEKIVVGIDARNGMAASEGWVQTSDISYVELAKKMEQFGVKYIIFTDIDRDGMLSGPNVEQLVTLNNAVSCNIVASGGIRDIEDIMTLKSEGIYGAILGRSIYKGTIDLKRAVEIAGE